MDKIASFEIDHTRLEPGFYVSRVDKVFNDTVTTFDLRIYKPNDGFLNPKAAHTLEHICATLLRNDPTYGDSVIYFGPMGCLTGFYLIMKGEYGTSSLLGLMRRVASIFGAAAIATEIPGCSKEECGNCEYHDLIAARFVAEGYEETLIDIYHNRRAERYTYPI